MRHVLQYRKEKTKLHQKLLHLLRHCFIIASPVVKKGSGRIVDGPEFLNFDADKMSM